MYYREAMDIDSIVENAIDREFYLRELENEKYEIECEDRLKYLLDEFEYFKDNQKLCPFNDFIIRRLELYIKSYNVEPETKFEDILDGFYTIITDEFYENNQI